MGRIGNAELLKVQFGVRQRTVYHVQLHDLWSLLGSFFICKVDCIAPWRQDYAKGRVSQLELLGLRRKIPGRWENLPCVWQAE